MNTKPVLRSSNIKLKLLKCVCVEGCNNLIIFYILLNIATAEKKMAERRCIKFEDFQIITITLHLCNTIIFLYIVYLKKKNKREKER